MGLFDDASSAKNLKKETVTPQLRNVLWTFYYSRILESTRERYISDIDGYLKKLWSKHFKQAVDSIPSYRSSWGDISVDIDTTVSAIRAHYLKTKDWRELYVIFEFTYPYIIPPCKQLYREELNAILEEERSPLRFVDNNFIEISNPLEIDEIENAAISTKGIYDPVYAHLNASVEYLSSISSGNYRNSVKESISAVEAMCKILVGDEKATLGSALKKLNLHPALEKSFVAMYGYTSDAGGVRHSLGFGDNKIEFFEAKYMLVSCSAFINYLKSKHL